MVGTPWAGPCPQSPQRDREPVVLRLPRRLLVLLAVVAAHTAVLVVLLEEDKRLPPERASDNVPAMVWLPPLTEPQARPAPTPAPAARAAGARARNPHERSDRVPSGPATPLVLAPPRSPENEPAITAPPGVDWEAEMGAAVTDRLAQDDEQRRRASIFAAPAAPASLAAPPPRGPPFRWDYAATHRIEFTPGGSLFVNLNDRCLYMFPIFLLCRFGEIPSHSDLFQHMKDPPAAGGP
jgi:hypothetical protein